MAEFDTTTLNTTGDVSVGDDLTVGDNLTVTGQINGGNSVGDDNQIGGANAAQTTIAAGTSYVEVNPDSVVIHGGDTSTTVTVNNAGVTVNDSTNGQTFAVSNTGNVSAAGSLTTGGAVNAGGGVNTATLVNGTANTGAGITINDSLTVSGTNATTLGGALTVGGLTTFNGAVQANGNITVGDGVAGVGNGTTALSINATTQRISGLAAGDISSAASTDAVTGGQLYATNQAIAGFNAGLISVNNRVDLLSRRVDKAYQGVAMGFASNAAPLNLANGEGGISAGVGYFQGEWGGAVRAQYVTDSGVGLGLNVGFSADAVGGGVGASIKF